MIEQKSPITKVMERKTWCYFFTETLYKNGSINREMRDRLKKNIALIKEEDVEGAAA